MTTDRDLALYLKLDDIGQNNEIVDASGKDVRTVLTGVPLLVPDDKFGSCLHFDGKDDGVLCRPRTASKFDVTGGVTVGVWVNIQSKAASERAVIAALYNAGNGDQYIMFYAENTVLNFKAADASVSVASALESDAWVYLAATIDREGNVKIYRDGHRLATGSKRFRVPSDLSLFRIGGFRENDGSGFRGKLAHARLYTSALTGDEIRRDMQRDQVAMGSFIASHPLDFRILDRDENAFLYVDDVAEDHEMTLEVSNNGNRPVVLAPPLSPPLLASSPREAEKELEEFFTAHSHLELRFRLGLLSEKSVEQLRTFQSRQFQDPQPASALAKALRGWYLFYQEHSALGSASLYLIAKNGRTLQPAAAGSGADTLAVTLAQITANPRGGARNTPFELRPGPLTKAADGAPLVGSRIHSVSVLNHRGRRHIPLHVGFVGSNTVLNDSRTSSSLTLRITNVSHRPIPLDADGESPARFIITFDEEDREWALGDTDQVGAVDVWASNSLSVLERLKKALQQGDGKNTQAQKITRLGDLAAKFIIERDHLPAGFQFEPNESIYVLLSNIKTAHPTGPANLYLHCENIPGYWDSQFVCPIQKAPLLFRDYTDGNRVGVGTNDPAAKLEIKRSGGGIGLYVRQEGAGNAAVFEGGGGVDISGVSNKIPLHLFGNTTSDTSLYVEHKGASNALHVKQQGTGNAVVFEGGGGVDISGVSNKIPLHLFGNTTSDTSLYVEHKGASNALHVKQQGTGNAAVFEGGDGVDIVGVAGRKHALHLKDNKTAYSTLRVENSGAGMVLRVKQKGRGKTAKFEGGGGVEIIGVTGNKHALYLKGNKTADSTLRVENNGAGTVLRVKQKGRGKTAEFEGGGGTDISNVTGKKHALHIKDNTTEYSTLRVENEGSGTVLRVKQTGEGKAASFTGEVRVDGELNIYGGQRLKFWNEDNTKYWAIYPQWSDKGDPDLIFNYSDGRTDGWSEGWLEPKGGWRSRD